MCTPGSGWGQTLPCLPQAVSSAGEPHSSSLPPGLALPRSEPPTPQAQLSLVPAAGEGLGRRPPSSSSAWLAPGPGPKAVRGRPRQTVRDRRRLERAETQAAETERQRVKAAGLVEGLYLREASAAPPACCWAQETAPAWTWSPLRRWPQARNEGPRLLGGKRVTAWAAACPLPTSSPPGPFLPCKSGPRGGTGSLGTLRKGGLSCQLCR